MIFDFWPSKSVTQEEAAPAGDNFIFQQIGSSFQQISMAIEKEVSIASGTSFTDKMKEKGMIVGLEQAPSGAPEHMQSHEDARLAEQSKIMVNELKKFYASIEQHANHVSCRMHDFRSYLMTHGQNESLDRDDIYSRAEDCVNGALGDLIVLKEHTKETISQLTLYEAGASRAFKFFDAIDMAYSELTTDMQAKLRLLKASLSR